MGTGQSREFRSILTPKPTTCLKASGGEMMKCPHCDSGQEFVLDAFGFDPYEGMDDEEDDEDGSTDVHVESGGQDSQGSV